VTLVSRRERAPGCASNLNLDELAAGDLDGDPRGAALRAHLASCDACRSRLAAREADPVLAPDAAALRPQVAALAARSARARRRRLAWSGAVGAAAAAAVLALVVRPGRGPDGERAKGAVALTLHVKRAPGAGAAGAAGAIEEVTGEGRLRAGDEVRFSLAPARPGHAVVLGLDAGPSVTVYVPAPGPAARAVAVAPPGPVVLPGSVVADATPGDEKIVAVVCDGDDATLPETLRQKAEAALARAGGRPEAVASLGTGCAEGAVLVHKEPR
jgi:hypothetical protein